LSHVGNGAQVRLGGVSWVAASALQDDKFFATTTARSRDGVRDLLLRSESCRDNERQSGSRRVVNQSQVHALQGGDLEAWGTEFDEEVNGFATERGTEALYASGSCAIEDWLVPLPRRLGFPVQVVD